MMPSDVGTWLKFALQQIAAESYLDRFLSGELNLTNVLTLGNNDTRKVNPDASGSLPNYTRMPSAQASTFAQEYDIIHHHANDATGFSATLLRNQTTGEYTLSFRSTEYRNPNEGGDFPRDGMSGAAGEIFSDGFALGQLAAMEAYHQELRTTGTLPSGATLSTTGFSLGGHLATIFTELHATDTDVAFGHTYTFNGAGRGHIDGTGATEAERIRGMLALFTSIVQDPDNALPYTTADDPAYIAASGRGAGWNPFLAGSSENAYLDPRYELAKQVVLSQYETSAVNLFNLAPPGEVGADPAFQNITQLFGHATHNDQEYVANSGVHGPTTSILVEDQPDLDGFGGFFGLSGDFGTTHSIVLIQDSLALTELYQTVDADVSRDTVEQIVAASSNQTGNGFVGTAGTAEGDSLENALDALREVYLGSVPATRFGRATGDFGQLQFRNEFYAHLGELKTQLVPNAG